MFLLLNAREYLKPLGVAVVDFVQMLEDELSK